jgi:hypothetical protein
MNTVASPDGTTIAFDRLGEGPPVGHSVDAAALAPALKEFFAESARG